jgi:predicted membrane chloride channel (bestrophin family)
MVFITFVPLALWPSCGWATPVLAPLVAFLLVGTENIGECV